MALWIDKVLTQLTVVGRDYTNDQTIRNKTLASMKKDLYLKACRVAYDDVHKFREYVDWDKPWDIYPSFLPYVLKPAK